MVLASGKASEKARAGGTPAPQSRGNSNVNRYKTFEFALISDWLVGFFRWFVRLYALAARVNSSAGNICQVLRMVPITKVSPVIIVEMAWQMVRNRGIASVKPNYADQPK